MSTVVNYRYRYCKVFFVVGCALWLMLGCKKFVELPPPSQSIVESNVFTSDFTAIAVMTSVYAEMASSTSIGSFTGSGGISVLTGLLGDELTLHSGIGSIVMQAYYKNNLGAIEPKAGFESWDLNYKLIYRCNAVLEGLEKQESINALSNAVRLQLKGETLFMRAFFHHYLANLYGDIPLILSTDYKLNNLLPRTGISKVNEQIIRDLELAKQLLSNDFSGSNLTSVSIERIRPTKWAAKAFLSRMYLYTGQYSKAEAEATEVIENTNLFNLVLLNNVFLKNSKEAIWQLQPTRLGFNTEEGNTYIIPFTGPSNSSNTNPPNPVYLSQIMRNAFETGDLRGKLGNWIDSTIYRSSSTTMDTVYYPFKYKVGGDASVVGVSDLKEYFMVFRLAEQYLIRAEARNMSGNLGGAISDLNTIRTRAGLSGTSASDQMSLNVAILRERQVELFSEWGHRWFDLKRTGNTNAVMSIITPLKGGTWEVTDQLNPLPFSELLKNPNLVQNAGY